MLRRADQARPLPALVPVIARAVCGPRGFSRTSPDRTGHTPAVQDFNRYVLVYFPPVSARRMTERQIVEHYLSIIYLYYYCPM